MATPAFKAAGNAASATTGTCAPPWPVGHAVGDVGFAIAESGLATTHTLSVASGFALVGTVIDASNLTRLTVWWCRATTTAQAAPTIAANASADHVHARVLTFSDVTGTGNPWEDFQTSSNAVAATAVSAPAVTTALANALILAIISRDNDLATAAFSAWTNASLTSVAEISDTGTANGNGGGFGAATGVKATAGAVSATTATSTPAVARASATLALKASAAGTATITGVAGTSAVGTVAATGDAGAVPSGVSATSAVGTLAGSGTALTSVSGVAGSSAVGSMVGSGGAGASVSGVSGTSAIGSLSAAGGAGAALTGVQGASAVGSVSGSGGSVASLSGVSLAGGVGSLSEGGTADEVMSGVSATMSAGTLTASSGAIPDDSNLGIPQGGIFTVPPIRQVREPLVSISATARIVGVSAKMHAGRMTAGVPVRVAIHGAASWMLVREVEVSANAIAVIPSAAVVVKAERVHARGIKVQTQRVIPRRYG